MLRRSTARFPNHEANPLIEENRRDIVERVIAEKADIGIAWDGDADRCFFIDGSGEFISGDFITALLAEAFLLKHPGATVIYDLRASYAVKDIVARYGGTALMNRVGHAFIKRRMREENAIFGGEVTGHYYFRDNFYADNGFIPALLILELMSRKGQTLRRAARAAARASTSSRARSTRRSASMDAVPTRSSTALAAQVRGRARVPRWTACRWSTRTGTSTCAPSNTEPLLRLNLEAQNAGADGGEARRGARLHPLVTSLGSLFVAERCETDESVIPRESPGTSGGLERPDRFRLE